MQSFCKAQVGISILSLGTIFKLSNMPATFFIADTHFGHDNICTFKRADGSPLRPFFSAQEMDEEMIKRWNERVRPKDTVYHLGDVLINKKHFGTLARLNGDKVLIKGNHDIFDVSKYLEYFRDIRAYHILNDMILSHIPIHPASLDRFKTNIHGHLHSTRVLTETGNIHKDYFCVSVEHTDYTPMSLEDVRKSVINQGEKTSINYTTD